MELSQAGILADVPRTGRYLRFSLTQPATAGDALRCPVPSVDGRSVVMGVGPALATALGAQVPKLREFPVLAGHGIAVPVTPTALYCWLRYEGDADAGDLVLLTRQLEKALAPTLHLDRVLDAFRHGRGPSGHGRDLTGYEDGTETPAEQDNMVGRRRSDNEELDNAPASAHAKRTTQESFEPEAFVLRRSLPWAVGHKAALMFVAYGCSFDAFEVQLRRMVGLDDGITDALFRIFKPVSGACFWCPPLRARRLDLRALAL